MILVDKKKIWFYVNVCFMRNAICEWQPRTSNNNSYFNRPSRNSSSNSNLRAVTKLVFFLYYYSLWVRFAAAAAVGWLTGWLRSFEGILTFTIHMNSQLLESVPTVNTINVCVKTYFSNIFTTRVVVSFYFRIFFLFAFFARTKILIAFPRFVLRLRLDFFSASACVCCVSGDNINFIYWDNFDCVN